MLRFKSSTVGVLLCCWMGLVSVHARVRAQSPSEIKITPAPPAVIRTDSAVVAPLVFSGSLEEPALRAQGLDNAAMDAKVARLRAIASAPAARGQRSATTANAAWVLGLLYLHGIGVSASPGDAAIWFERARVLGEPMAVAGLAWCDVEGCLAAPNPALARRWLPALRAANAPRAQYFQWLMETRLAPLQVALPSLKTDSGTALTNARLPHRYLLLSAAQGGDVQAAIELGFESIAANRTAQALAYFRAVAPKSEVAAANVALLLAQRAPFDNSLTTTAQDYLERAQRNHRGEGQSANYVEAIRLYQLAKDRGNIQATKMLALVFSRPLPSGQIDIAWMQQLAYVSFSKDATSISNSSAHHALRRDATPLYDLLPLVWRNTQPALVP